MRSFAKPLVPIAAAAALLGTGCGSDKPDRGKAYIPAQTRADDQPRAAKSSIKIDLKDIQFSPHLVTVKPGGSITWTNSDRVTHTVTKRDGVGAKFDATVKPGKKYTQTIGSAEAGQISYLCEIHANMTATIRVAR